VGLKALSIADQKTRRFLPPVRAKQESPAPDVDPMFFMVVRDRSAVKRIIVLGGEEHAGYGQSVDSREHEEAKQRSNEARF
jgi:hypothetical protein